MSKGLIRIYIHVKRHDVRNQLQKSSSFKSEIWRLTQFGLVSFTSFKHHPVYSSFILEIPDNYSNGSYLNVELSDLRVIVDYALENGFTVSWDGDVSESGFRAKEGFAVLSNISDSTFPYGHTIL